MQEQHYQLNEAKMFADVSEGTAIVIDSTTGIYYGMNRLGTSIYECLQAGSSTTDILAAIKFLPGASLDFEASFEQFINTLLEYGIIVPCEAASSADPVIDPAVADADAFLPECTAYQDVQELLYADPIHEVDAEEGWMPE